LVGIGFIGLLYDAHHAATDADTGVTDTQRRRALAQPILAVTVHAPTFSAARRMDERIRS
jgi:hypothetical protein